LRDFWYEAQKKQKNTRENNGLQGWNDMAVWREQKKKKNTRENNGLQGWNDVAVWRDFKPQYISGDIWPQHIEHVMFE
jgi:hypothetical protein